MSRAQEKAFKAYNNEPCNKDTQNMVDSYIKGYEQAEKDMMEYFKMWVAHNGYTAEQAKLVCNDFREFIS